MLTEKSLKYSVCSLLKLYSGEEISTSPTDYKYPVNTVINGLYYFSLKLDVEAGNEDTFQFSLFQL